MIACRAAAVPAASGLQLYYKYNAGAGPMLVKQQPRHNTTALDLEPNVVQPPDDFMLVLAAAQ